jgi:hypothetical protein
MRGLERQRLPDAEQCVGEPSSLSGLSQEWAPMKGGERRYFPHHNALEQFLAVISRIPEYCLATGCIDRLTRMAAVTALQGLRAAGQS